MIEIDNIYLGDCLELMQEMDDKSVDAVICDLPYGVTGNAWDSVLPFEKLWAQYKRITKENCAIVLFAAEPFATMLRMSNMKQYRYDWIWQKHVPVGFLNSNIRPLRAYENICVFYCQQPTYNPQGLRPANRRVERTGPGGNYGEIKNNSYTAKYTGYPTDVLYFETDKTHYHPTQKPVNLIRYLIRTYTNQGGVILDNCMGSGTTCVACIKENRHFIGMERDNEYYNIASQRIKEETAQLSLF